MIHTRVFPLVGKSTTKLASGRQGSDRNLLARTSHWYYSRNLTHRSDGGTTITSPTATPRDFGIIAAMSHNHIIGVNYSVPWNVPKDWKAFVEVTQNKAFIIGRKTLFEGSRRNFDHLAHCQRVVVVSNTLLDRNISELNMSSSPGSSSGLPFFHLASSVEASILLAQSIINSEELPQDIHADTRDIVYPWERVDTWIGGGEQTFQHALTIPQARFVYLTELNAEIHPPTSASVARFPDKSTWEHLYTVIHRTEHFDHDPLPFVTTVYERLVSHKNP